MRKSIDQFEVCAQQPVDRQPAIMELGHRFNRGKRRFEDQSRGGLLRGQFPCDRPAERATEQDHALGANHSGSREVVVRAERILVKPLFRWSSQAPTVAAIVEEKDRQSQLVEEFQILETVSNIAGIPMAPEYDWSICSCVNIPTEQSNTISSVKPYLLER
jgi:hypothetical protein